MSSHLGIADHEPDPAQDALFERDQELDQEANTELSVTVDAHGHHDSSGVEDVGVIKVIESPCSDGA